MKPLISVVLITYNRPNYLKECINSILSQTFKQFELFILDNGSDFSTKDIINQFSDKRIKYIRNKINSKNFINKGFEFTKNKYLMITHDDDLMEKDFLKIQLSYLEKDDSLDLAASSISLINSKGENLKKIRPRILTNKIWKKKQFINDYLFKGDIVPCPTCIFRSKFIFDYNLKYNEKVGPAADLYLLFKINLLNSKIFLNKSPLYKYRIHKNQDSYKNKIEMEYKIRPFIIDLLNENKELRLRRKYESASNGIILNTLFEGLITKKYSISFFLENFSILRRDCDLKLNKYSIYWSIIGIVRGYKNLLV